MPEDHFRKELLLSLQRALLGNIRASYRVVCYRIHSFREITIRVYCSAEPSDADREMLSEATTEVYADFPELQQIHEECVYSADPVGTLDQLDGCVFAKNEYATEG